mmetsp:Transcript_6067/g.9819  ORF Transcript_6067/g.9819 Transcript_6067/m.9819 type:complete len:237 (-) Transcript_6067:8-718(-)
MPSAQPPRSLNREEVRLVDANAEKMGQPGIVLMENAGLGLTKEVEDELSQLSAPAGAVVGIVCGRGNNGGDGYVCARHLQLRGYTPKIAFCGDRAKADRKQDYGINLTVVENFGISVTDVTDGEQLSSLLGEWNPTLLVDAMLGTGLTGELRDDYKSWISALNASKAPIIAVDIPSGLDCDTGLPLGASVKACKTVTFVARKIGFDQPGAEDYTGKVVVVSIGCPSTCWGHVSEAK